MLVNLKRDFYGDKLYEARHNPVEVAEEFRHKLPPGAEIVELAPIFMPKARQEPVALSQLGKSKARGPLDEE